VGLDATMNRLPLPLVLLLCVNACAAPPPPAATVPPPPAEFARRAGELLEQNYRPDAPGVVVLVARGDTVLFRAARGEADFASKVPLRPEAVFRIGSITKQFAAAGLLKLVDHGRVKLRDPLSRYVPDFPGGNRITLRHLLNHTSGIASYTDLPNYMERQIQRDLTTAQMIDVFRNLPPRFPPGSHCEYSNSNYVLVGAVIEAVSGVPWYSYLEEALFEPLGMRQTGFGPDPRFAVRQVPGHSYEGQKVVPARSISMTQAHAAGALVSSADDLLTWNRALHGGRVLERSTYAQMVTPVGKAADGGVRSGFGLIRERLRGRETLWHGGDIFGFSAALIYTPGPDITVVVMENDDAEVEQDDAKTFARKLAALALGDR